MADIVDSSNDHSDHLLAAATAYQRSKATERELFPVGYCYYCDCTVSHGQLFCDALCRDDHAAEKAAMARNGR